MYRSREQPVRAAGPSTRAAATSVLLALLTGVLLAPGVPAQAAAGAGCEGVVVVVGPPGATEQAECVREPGGSTAAELFEDTGHRLTRVQRFPGAVCRVDGVPAEQACVAMPPADSYWGFFRTGEDGWIYATVGVDSVVPEVGDGVALVWQEQADPSPPAYRIASGTPDDTEPEATTPPRPAPETGIALPGWVPGILVVVMLGGAVVAARRRRRR